MATRSTASWDSQPEIDPGTRKESEEIGRVLRDAVRAAREENRRLGIPNVQVEEDGHLTEELPDGTTRPIRER